MVIFVVVDAEDVAVLAITLVVGWPPRCLAFRLKFLALYSPIAILEKPKSD